MTETEVAKENVAAPVSDLEQKIIRQLEYYFSDSNLYRDKFLQEQIKKDDGWVELTTLLTFKRLSALSEDPKIIVDAIEKSDEGLVEISEDRTKLRRHHERPLAEQNEEVRKEIVSRTAYVKGFPLDATMDDLIEFFNQYEKVTNIVMRKYLDKPTKVYKFKGSVFATFVTKDQCESFLNKEGVEYKEAALIRKWQNVYNDEKKAERDSKNKKKQKDQKPEDAIELPKNATIHLDGIDPETTREVIREVFNAILGDLQISFIDFDTGNTSGYIRFSTEDAGPKFIEKITDSKLTIKDKEVTVRVLKDDEETEYLKLQVENIKKRREFQNNKSKKGGPRGRNKFSRKRKNGGDKDDDDDEPPAKK